MFKCLATCESNRNWFSWWVACSIPFPPRKSVYAVDSYQFIFPVSQPQFSSWVFSCKGKQNYLGSIPQRPSLKPAALCGAVLIRKHRCLPKESARTSLLLVHVQHSPGLNSSRSKSREQTDILLHCNFV